MVPSAHSLYTNDPDATGKEVESIDASGDPDCGAGGAHTRHLHHCGGVVPET